MIEKVHEVNDAASNMAAITEEQSASAEEIEATAVSIRGTGGDCLREQCRCAERLEGDGKHGRDAEGTYFQVYDLELAEEVLSYYSVDRDSD